MIVVPPLAISDLNLTSSNSAEPCAPANWNSGTTYNLNDFITDPATLITYQSLQSGNVNYAPAASPLWWDAIGLKEVIWSSGTTYPASTPTSPVYAYYNHRIYQSLLASNTGNNPFASPTWWEDMGPTLQYAMFDTLRNTATVAASPLVVAITPGARIDTVAALNVVADTVRVQMTSSGVSVYDQTATLTARDVSDWYDYFFAPFRQVDAYLFQDLPPYSTGLVTVTFTRAAGNVSCGALCLGMSVDLGTTQKQPQDDATNYSTIDRDDFGTAVLIPRRSVPKTTQITWLESSEVDSARAVRKSLNAVPAVWAGIVDSSGDYFESLLILGIYRQFMIELDNPTQATLTLELEEV